MGDVIPLHRPEDYSQALQRIKRLRIEGTTTFATRVINELKEWRLDIADIHHLIQYGRIVSHSKPGQYWNYRIWGESVDGIKLICRVEVRGYLLIISLINLQKTKRKEEERKQ